MRLRIATTEEAGSVEMPEAIEAMIKECIAAQPVAVLIAWETSDKEEFGVSIRSVPDSHSLRRGMADLISQIMYPEDHEEKN